MFVVGALWESLNQPLDKTKSVTDGADIIYNNYIIYINLRTKYFISYTG